MPLFRSSLVVVALLGAAGLVRGDEVHSLNGTIVAGTVTSINGTQISVKGKDGQISALPLAQVLNVNIRPVRYEPPAKFTDVVLTDDTVLHCKSIAFQGKEVELALPSGAILKVPLTTIVSFVREANNQPLARKFEELAVKKVIRDRIVILREGQLNTLEGTLGEVKGQTISFRSELNGNVVDIPFEKLHGIIFFRNPAVPVGSGPICRVNDIEGNTLTAVKLAFDGVRLTVTTTTGTELVMPQETLANLDFNLGKLTFLSSMVPTKIVEKSGIGLVHSFRRDKNLDDQQIYLDRPYDKGLSMHAYTDLEYNLGGKFKEFRGVLGVDARTGAESQPKVTIYCDDVVVFSNTVTAQNVQPVNLNVKGVKVLRIVVSSRNILDLHDHVTLAEAQVSQ